MYFFIFYIFLIFFLPVNSFAAMENFDKIKNIADRGNPLAQYEIGKYYIELGNEEIGLSYLNRACRNYHTASCDYIKNFYSEKLSSEHIGNMSISQQIDKSIEYYKKRQFLLSFPIFSNLCSKDIEIGCLYTARSYMHGNGTKVDLYKAKEILDKYRGRHDAFKSDEAFLYEYLIGTDDEDINKAIGIYYELKDSPIEWIAKEANKGINRIPVYSFLNSYLPIQGNYFSDKLNYEGYNRAMYNIDLKDLPADIYRSFSAMRDACMRLAKRNDEIWLKIGKSAANSFIQTFTGGWLGFLSSMTDSFSEDAADEAIADECKRMTNSFYDELGRYEISAKWVNSKERRYFPSK